MIPGPTSIPNYTLIGTGTSGQGSLYTPPDPSIIILVAGVVLIVVGMVIKRHRRRDVSGSPRDDDTQPLSVSENSFSH